MPTVRHGWLALSPVVTPDAGMGIRSRFQAPLAAAVIARRLAQHDVGRAAPTVSDAELLPAPLVDDLVVAIVGMRESPQLAVGMAPASLDHVDTFVVAASGSQPRDGALFIEEISFIEICRPRVFGPLISTSEGSHVC